MTTTIKVVDEESFINLVALFDETIFEFAGPKASIITDDIMFKKLDNKPLEKNQWVEYKSGEKILKIILTR